jgi:argininosuccinate lyase
MKLWQKNYKLNKEIEKFTVGNDYLLDKKLLKYDVVASMAHAKMLEKIGVLKDAENKKLQQQLQQILELDKKEVFKIKLSDEDCHTAIENFLTKKLGSLGKKIHTGRSRNDQSLAAIRLYVKEEIRIVEKHIQLLVKAMKQRIKKKGRVQMPGYTHMQKAMPSSIGLWLGAFVESLSDDLNLLDSVKKLNDQCPLGSAAGYGTPLNLDRAFVAKELNFTKIQNNTLYVQNSRGKFELLVLQALQQVMLDLNKLATDMMLFSTAEFSFIELPEEFCTGSSIMPQKKNPDVLELVRAKYGMVSGYATQIATVIANLPSGYNRDFQLTKESLIKGVETTKETISVMTLVVATIKVNKENCSQAMTPDLYATEKAYKLVSKGIPFREAYKKASETWQEK